MALAPIIIPAIVKQTCTIEVVKEIPSNKDKLLASCTNTKAEVEYVFQLLKRILAFTYLIVVFNLADEPFLVIQHSPSIVIIFLHGLGDTGHGWASEIAQIKPPHTKLICPTAPNKPVTINGGAMMPAWYDIVSLEKGREDKNGIVESSAYIQSLIQGEVDSGIAAERIILSGFSQGAAMSLYTGLMGKHALGGIVAMSGYLPLYDTIKWDSVKKPPILMCHGDKDQVVHYNIGLATKARLEEQKFPNFTFKAYRGLDHSASLAEINDIKDFYHKILQQIPIRSEL